MQVRSASVHPGTPSTSTSGKKKATATVLRWIRGKPKRGKPGTHRLAFPPRASASSLLRRWGAPTAQLFRPNESPLWTNLRLAIPGPHAHTHASHVLTLPQASRHVLWLKTFGRNLPLSSPIRSLSLSPRRFLALGIVKPSFLLNYRRRDE